MSPIYRKGEPPSLGWWPTLVDSANCGNGLWLRWWDGRQWSCGAQEGYTAEEAAHCAAVPAPFPDWQIRWTDRPASWPARSLT